MAWYNMFCTGLAPWSAPPLSIGQRKCGAGADQAPSARTSAPRSLGAHGSCVRSSACPAAVVAYMACRHQEPRIRRRTLQLRDAPGCTQNGCACATQAEDYPFKSSQDYQHHHVAVRRLAEWQRLLGLHPPEVFAAEPRGHRTRTKLAVAPGKDGVVLGLFKRGTQEVLPALGCAALHPVLRQALVRLQKALDGLKSLALYDPGVKSAAQSAGGALRFVQLTVERPSQRVQLVLVWTCKRGPAVPALERLVELLWDDDPGDVWHSIWIHWREPKPNLGNFVFALETSAWELAQPRALSGGRRRPGFVYENLDGLEFTFGPFNFQQANLVVFEQILRDMKRMLRERAAEFEDEPVRLLELHAGIGVIGLSLAHELASRRGWASVALLSSDENPKCAAPFTANARGIVPDLEVLSEECTFTAGARVGFSPLSAEEVLDRLSSSNEGPHVLVMDPPRTGLAPRGRKKAGAADACVRRIRAMPDLRLLIYMSCGPRSFRADASQLIEAAPEDTDGSLAGRPFKLLDVKCSTTRI
ncbi:unnamed protein product [Symbiodinium natans]|uniref:Uncharacterized protein n=1 Tax=Symbiodinium natans TaxID=878477 RepID=A0A812V232_9DINO|nr:unnamed protein product [Symbiodinium natans]